VEVILGVLRGDVNPAGYEHLYLVDGEAVSDAATALSLLPPEQAGPDLAGLCDTLDEVSADGALNVTRALLEIVFPDEGYDEDEPLTGPQRQVITAIAGSNAAWTFNANLIGILSGSNLPCQRDELRALADGSAAPETQHV
jgi:hypothetical protein